MELKTVAIDKPEDVNVIIGQSHFIKTVEDVYEAMVNAVPSFKFKFGVAFCEASGPCLVRCDGNDDEMIGLAKKNALALSCGHVFVVFIRDAFPLNFLRAIRDVPEVCCIFCATANPVDVVIAENERGRGIMGVIDGDKSKGVETEQDVLERKEMLRKFAYKR